MNPINKFSRWYYLAENLQGNANVCTIGTSNHGRPHLRSVLLKGITDDGFIFYTNYESDKAKHIAENPDVCMHFYWPNLDRQVIINGYACKVSREQSETYFKTRPYLSKIGAWGSKQSQPLRRIILLLRCVGFIFRFRSNVPCPMHWGGYLIRPVAMEFWHGKNYRLHVREKYQLIGTTWTKTIVSP
jgi:pyridoxamine 5'-phosphate oxidase